MIKLCIRLYVKSKELKCGLDSYLPPDSIGSEYNFGAPSRTRVIAFLYGLLTLD